MSNIKFKMPIGSFHHSCTAEGVEIAQKKSGNKIRLCSNYGSNIFAQIEPSLLMSITPKDGGSQKKLFEIVQKTERPRRIN